MTLRIQIPPNRVGLMVKKSRPQNRIVGEITFLGHTVDGRNPAN